MGHGRSVQAGSRGRRAWESAVLLLLDLARVGTGRGTGTMTLLTRLRQEDPDLEITVGGGVARRDELLGPGAGRRRRGPDRLGVS